MKRDRSEIGRALANIDQQIGELQRARQILLDARTPPRLPTSEDVRGILPKRHRRTKAELAAIAREQEPRD